MSAATAQTAAEAYPLSWPAGWPRTSLGARTRARFKVTLDRARYDLLDELRRLGARDFVLSTNMPLRLDGQVRAGARAPDDAGVAVYFTWKKRQHVMACDRFQSVAENLRSIGLSIQALRALDRYGASEILERAFTGFLALPAPHNARAYERPRAVFGWSDDRTYSREDVEARFRELAKERHPDVGGDAGAFAELLAARDELIARIGGAA